MNQIRFLQTDDVHQYLDSIPMFGQAGSAAARFDLKPIRAFLTRLGDPHKRVPVIHVAGTNGKGTTCRMLASVFQEAGYRTGLYTSPHLIRFHERFRINGKMIDDGELLQFFQQFESDLLARPLTYFELSTVIAFWYFAESDCDIAIIETGLGGRLDATNVVDPLISVITSVSLDHTDLLGASISQIAREKAGIIKPLRPVVIGPLPDDAFAEVLNKAHETGSRVYVSSRTGPVWNRSVVQLQRNNGLQLELKLAGRKPVDRYNAAITLLVAELLEEKWPGLIESIQKAMEQLDTRFGESATFQKLLPDRSWYFDGAHNAEAIRSLFEMILEGAGGREPVVFLSMMRDKATPAVLKQFRNLRTIYYTTAGTNRSATCEEIQQILPKVQCLEATDPGINGLLDSLKSELVIFTGSFYFYTQVQHWIASQPPSDKINNPVSGL